MNAPPIQTETANALLGQLQEQNPDPVIRLSPYLDFSSGSSNGYRLGRKLSSTTLRYSTEAALKANSESRNRDWRKDIGALVNKLSCEAALSNVELQGDRILTPASDDVATIDATGGLTIEILEDLISRFDYAEDVVLVVCSNELERLNWLAQANQSDRRFAYRGGEVTHFSGTAVIPIYTYKNKPILQEKHGVRSCFALQKGGVQIQINWSLQDEGEIIAVEVGAVRIDGEKVIELATTY